MMKHVLNLSRREIPMTEKELDIQTKMLRGEYLLSLHDTEHWECDYGEEHEFLDNGRCKWCNERKDGG